MPRFSLRTVGILLLPLVLAAGAAAQTRGTIRGQAMDQDGGLLPGVLVEVTSETRGTLRSTITGDTGHFVLAGMNVDDYTLTAALDGFHTQTREHIHVGIDSTVSLELIFSLASIAESILVSSTPLLDVTSSTLVTSFESEFIEELPVERYYFMTFGMTPGISVEAEDSDSMSAFGSSISSNSWMVDGADTTNADTGDSYWWINPETVEEVQVTAIGAPAQYGNMSGAAFNVVTKSGTNTFSGSANFYYQSDSLTSTNAELNGIPFERQDFLDVSLTLGGPIVRDKLWFFAAYQDYTDTFSDPGVDPAFPSLFPSKKYDIKLDWAISDSSSLNGKFHTEDWEWEYGDAFSTPDAETNQGGDVPAWQFRFNSVLNSKNFLEVGYAAYSSSEHVRSRTGSDADPFIDYSPPDGGPARYSEGLFYPYTWDLERDQFDATLSTYAEDFLQGDHEFKFGIAYGTGLGDTTTAGGPNGVYYYRYDYVYDYYGYEYIYPYYYRVTGRPYHYGAETETASAFIDDSWKVSDKLTVNVGIRYDSTNADIPDYPLLNQDWSETGETIPGQKDAVQWRTWSPRIGFAYQVGDSGVLRGFYGKFYDANVTGNWYAPPPDAPSYLYEFSANRNGPWTPFFLFEQKGTTVNPNLKPPETDQITFGYEHKLNNHLTLGVQGVWKNTKNLIGFEILGDGTYEMVPWTNPFDGQVYELASIVEQPSTWKGNQPGVGSLAPPGQKFEQEYKGAFVALNKRYANGWSMQASYTWSDSTGFLPRPLDQSQGAPFYAGGEGQDPNNWINAQQALQNEREHVVQLQALADLPWDLVGTMVFRYLDGKPYNRQMQLGGGSYGATLNQGNQGVIVIPASSDNVKTPSQFPIDLSLGRYFPIGGAELELRLQVFNLLNEDANQWWETLTVPPGSEYVPSGYVFPRRWMIKAGLGF